MTAARRGIERAMRLIVTRGKPPYRAGWRIWGTAMRHAGASHEVTWLLWGALTDRVEAKPEESRQAEDAMRRAAQEWLSLTDNVEGQRAYFERWLYQEMGYKRPQRSTPAS